MIQLNIRYVREQCMFVCLIHAFIDVINSTNATHDGFILNLGPTFNKELNHLKLSIEQRTGKGGESILIKRKIRMTLLTTKLY